MSIRPYFLVCCAMVFFTGSAFADDKTIKNLKLDELGTSYNDLKDAGYSPKSLNCRIVNGSPLFDVTYTTDGGQYEYFWDMTEDTWLTKSADYKSLGYNRVSSFHYGAGDAKRHIALWRK
jgi:hypothetical protein